MGKHSTTSHFAYVENGIPSLTARSSHFDVSASWYLVALPLEWESTCAFVVEGLRSASQYQIGESTSTEHEQVVVTESSEC